MIEEKPLINRVDESGIITLDLADFFPAEPIEEFDLKNFLVKELVLMEKPFRETLKNIDWNIYHDKVVAIHCSSDAIIPMWAYMLVTSYMEPHAGMIFYGTKDEAVRELLIEKIEALNPGDYKGKRVVIKGCGDKPLPPGAYMLITKKLQAVVQSLMYGEPCSAVPVYKRPKSP